MPYLSAKSSLVEPLDWTRLIRGGDLLWPLD